MYIQLPIRISRCSDETLQSQIINQLRDSIGNGCLKPASRLPSVRELAKQLGVSVNTVLLAYDELHSEGIIERKPGLGTYVSDRRPADFILTPAAEDGAGAQRRERLADRQPPVFSGRRQMVVRDDSAVPDIDFWLGRPDAGSFPLKAWRRTVNVRLKHAGQQLVNYGDPAGLYELRAAIADHLAQTRGFRARPEQIIITHGIQEGLSLVSRLLLRTGAEVLVESPCYTGAYYLFESYGARLHSVPVDTGGLQANRLPSGDISLAYVTPSHQYPTGYTLSYPRRQQLLAWAWQHNCYIFEDDYDADFRYGSSPLPALMSLDSRGCVIYAGTFSKSMGAGLRLGYLVLPAEIAEHARTVKSQLDNGNSWLNQAAMADFIRGGDYLHHLHRIRERYRNRQETLIRQLSRRFGEAEVSGTEGGMHLAWHLPDTFPDADSIQRMSEAVGVGVYTIKNCASLAADNSRISHRVLLFGYAAVPEVKITEAVARMARLPL